MKKFYAFLLIITFAILLISCSKDDDSNKNATPLIQEQTFTVAENIVGINIIGTVTATDADKDILTFIIITNDSNLFLITTDGKLTLASGKNLDYETKTSHQITIQVSDGKTTASTIITINVTDIDENQAPTIDEQSFEISENINDTSIIATVVATDPNDDELIFSITNDEDNLFEITINGELSLQNGKTLDFETKILHEIIVQVSDGSISSNAIITINVTDIYENQAPNIIAQSFEASEDLTYNNVIGTVIATDLDENELTFSITNDEDNLFKITRDGQLSLNYNKYLDYETKKLHEITVEVKDNKTKANAIITINIIDVEGINIPDNNFKAYLLSNRSINKNDDVEISALEADAFTGYIDCSSLFINDLTGIEAFKNVTEIYCDNNLLKELDLSNNKLLTRLSCTNNQLTKLDLTENIGLVELICSNNSLTNLDLTNNLLLTYVLCHTNSLTSLNVTNNKSLRVLGCSANKLTSLDITNNISLTDLKCAGNSLTSLDVSNNILLKELGCQYNSLISLDLTNNTFLTNILCLNNSLTKLDFSRNPALELIFCDSNQLNELNIANGNNNNLKSLRASNNINLSCIQIDHNFTPPALGWQKDATANYSDNCP